MYFGSYSLVLLIIEPAQHMLNPTSIFYGYLIFLPHGIRILTIWLYGFWGAAYLLPVVVLTSAVYQPEFEITWPMILLASISITSAVVSFAICRAAGLLLRLAEAAKSTWRDLLIVGSVAAALNAFLHWLVLPSASSLDFSAIFVGDILGLILMLALMMISYRFLRKLSNLVL